MGGSCGLNWADAEQNTTGPTNSAEKETRRAPNWQRRARVHHSIRGAQHDIRASWTKALLDANWIERRLVALKLMACNGGRKRRPTGSGEHRPNPDGMSRMSIYDVIGKLNILDASEHIHERLHSFHSFTFECHQSLLFQLI